MSLAQIRTLGGSGGLIEGTYASILALKTAGTLVKGAHYKITDRADAGIILFAADTNQLSLEGEGIFFNPDFQSVGDYSSVVGYTTTQGVWADTLEGTYTDGEVVFWDGIQYLVISAASVNGNTPAINNTAYQALAKSATTGYIEETDFILYDFDADTIIKRADKRGNEVYKDVTLFQFGNDSVTGCKDYNGNVTCINQKGILTDLVFAARYAFTLDYSFINTFSNRSITEYESTFSIDLNMTDGTDYDLATQTLTLPDNFYGVFTLINNTGQTISKISAPPFAHKFRIYVEQGNTQLFSHTAVASANTGDLISDAAAINTITGDNSDFIEYEQTDIAGGKTVNRRYNAVISA